MIPKGAGWHLAALAAELGLIGVIGVLVLALAYAHNVSFDLTPTKEHTLSDQAQRTGARLDRDVTVTAFYNSQDQGRVRYLKDLLQKFEQMSSHFHFRMYDLDRSPLLANQYGIVGYNAGVIEDGDRKIVVRDLAEASLTTNLIKIIEGLERTALFSTGHGEADAGNPDEREGLSLVAKALEADNYRIERSNDLRNGIPENVALLVIAGPTTDFTETEIQVVRDYLERGGGALILLEADGPKRLQALVKEFGIFPGNDLIVDERNRLFFADSFAPQVAFFNEQILPYTGAPPAVLPLAQSMTVGPPPREGVTNAPLAFTGADTWADAERVSVENERPFFREGIDRVGPVPVAAIAHVEAKEGAQPAAPGRSDANGSLIVVGDAAFATNLYSGTLGNQDLFLNLSHLAARAEALIAVRENNRPGGTFSRIYLTAGQATALFWSSVVILPVSVLLVGLFVGLRRRQRTSG